MSEHTQDDDTITRVISLPKNTTCHLPDCCATATATANFNNNTNMSPASSKPSSRRHSSSDHSSSSASPKRSALALRSSLRDALTKPFRGWSRHALWAKSDLDDVYNFPATRRRGAGEDAE